MENMLQAKQSNHLRIILHKRSATSIPHIDPLQKIVEDDYV